MNKYNAKKVEIDGITFDSKKEAARYCDLKLMQRAGEIRDLQLQVEYELIPKQAGERACQLYCGLCLSGCSYRQNGGGRCERI